MSEPPQEKESPDASQDLSDKEARKQEFQALVRKFEETFQRLGPAGWLALVAATMPAIGGFVLLWQIPAIEAWLLGMGSPQGEIVYIIGFAILAGFALLPTYAQAVLAGHAFGLANGGAAAIIGFAFASLLAYFVAKRASGDRAITIIEEQPKWRAVYNALLKSGNLRSLGIVTLLRIPPNSPFAVTNLVMAATKVPLWIYVTGTVIGMTPRTLAAVYIGTTVVNWGEKTSAQRWMTVIGIALIIIVIGIIGTIAKRAIDRATLIEEPTVIVPPED